MTIHKSYKGILNDKKYIWIDSYPKDAIIEKETIVYRPDEGYIFVKDGIEYNCVILQEGESIEDYQEIEKKED